MLFHYNSNPKYLENVLECFILVAGFTPLSTYIEWLEGVNKKMLDKDFQDTPIE